FHRQSQPSRRGAEEAHVFRLRPGADDKPLAADEMAERVGVVPDQRPDVDRSRTRFHESGRFVDLLLAGGQERTPRPPELDVRGEKIPGRPYFYRFNIL